jgi:hypothetical protein
MKVAELTQTRVTPFKDGMLGDSWWYWSKHKHPKINIWLAEGLEVCRV